jgi:hypothetical protein
MGTKDGAPGINSSAPAQGKGGVAVGTAISEPSRTPVMPANLREGAGKEAK